MAFDPALLPDDVDALKRLIVGMAREAVQADTLIEKLRFELARLKRARFGASSEKLGERVEQLELAIEALETDAAERLAPTPAIAKDAMGMDIPTTVELTPVVRLLDNTEYTVTVKAGVMDTMGAATAADHVFKFTTGTASADAAPPSPDASPSDAGN